MSSPCMVTPAELNYPTLFYKPLSEIQKYQLFLNLLTSLLARGMIEKKTTKTKNFQQFFNISQPLIGQTYCYYQLINNTTYNKKKLYYKYILELSCTWSCLVCLCVFHFSFLNHTRQNIYSGAVCRESCGPMIRFHIGACSLRRDRRSSWICYFCVQFVSDDCITEA